MEYHILENSVVMICILGVFRYFCNLERFLDINLNWFVRSHRHLVHCGSSASGPLLTLCVYGSTCPLFAQSRLVWWVTQHHCARPLTSIVARRKYPKVATSSSYQRHNVCVNRLFSLFYICCEWLNLFWQLCVVVWCVSFSFWYFLFTFQGTGRLKHMNWVGKWLLILICEEIHKDTCRING